MKLHLMKRCLTLAVKARGQTSPNPMVGALLYKDGKVLAEDYHKKAGTPHAEALVLEQAGQEARDATLFVTLEPCCHKDKRTPPCTDAIIRAGVREVVIAMQDPNPAVAGKGIEALNNAGITTQLGIMQEKAMRLNEAYIKYITTRTPFVILKVAMTLDGKIATPDGKSKWITCEASRRVVHQVRASVDAVLSAVGTVKADNPGFKSTIRGGRSPMRVIIDPALDIPEDFNVLKTPPETILVTKKCDTYIDQLAPYGQTDQPAPYGQTDQLAPYSRWDALKYIYYDGELDLQWLMRELGKTGVTSVMVEGGASLTGYAIEAGIVDKVMFFIAPKIVGGKGSLSPVASKTFRSVNEAYGIVDMTVRKIGCDILIEGYIGQ
ncbi:MAG: bifunctional diaminohydroxyphosphoribosylaminopyrimidine deaminase/5-amino-6-(5-phosphoribosylamino)uracil reductase RibD [Nitrospirae bacterium]|nr:bifunctional diaminohydroxyphosphoribosylaminopyrimidine deaminase/5-amino-6-(5-phosphoribosylamino)uracil reductase RibD [Nitrospirota bacterium]